MILNCKKSELSSPEKHPNALLPKLTLREELGLVDFDFCTYCFAQFYFLETLIPTSKF